MDVEERDHTDLGLAVIDERPRREQLRELAAVRADRLAEKTQPRRPASPAARRRAMDRIRQACGWTRESQSGALAKPCSYCGARPTVWCRRGRYGLPEVGRICPERGE